MSFLDDLIEWLRSHWIEISCGGVILIISVAGFVIYRRNQDQPQQNDQALIVQNEQPAENQEANKEENGKKKEEENKETKSGEEKGIFAQSREVEDPIMDNFWVTHGVYLITVIAGCVTGRVGDDNVDGGPRLVVPTIFFFVLKLIIPVVATYIEGTNSLKINFAKAFDYQALINDEQGGITLRVVESIAIIYSYLYAYSATWKVWQIFTN